MFRSYRSEDEEDELEDEDEDDGSSVEEVDDDAVHGQGIQSSEDREHREHQVSGVELGAVAGGESVPAYSQPSKGSNVEIGSNGYAVSPIQRHS